jgi:phosphoribosylformimino-5-aminoimidazole carboxamide ribotide isomerase
MIIFPAIDLAQGKCVRLIQGERKNQTVYSESPAEVALEWQRQGASYLHIVDLDGAFDGVSQNRQAVEKIRASVQIPIQLGGGIRSLENIEAILKTGISRVILGTVICENPNLLEKALVRFGPDKIVAGIDAKKGKVAVRGWCMETDLSPLDLGKQMKDMGINTFIYTDILRDGMLGGPNIEAQKEFADHIKSQVIASGGISSLEDIRTVAKLEKHGIIGMIIGKSLYENRFTLTEALNELKQFSLGKEKVC